MKHVPHAIAALQRIAIVVVAAAIAIGVSACDDDVRWSWFANDAPALAGIAAKSDAPFRIEDARGHVVLVTFGYTQCVDLCPFTLEKIDAMYKKLAERGVDADLVRTEFVSIDPSRDSIEALRALVEEHDAHVDGLWIDEASLAATTSAWDVVAKKHGANLRRVVASTPDAGDYSFEHTATIFVVDAAGKLRARVNHAATPATIADVVTKVAREVRARALRVVDASVRLNESTGAGAAYFTIVNDGDDDDRLIGVSSPNAASATLHETIVDGDVVAMRSIEEVVVPAHGRVVLEPGRTHVMLSGVQRNAKSASSIPLVLRFAKSGEIRAEAEVHR